MNSETDLIFWLIDPGILPSILIAAIGVLLIKTSLRLILYKETQPEDQNYRKILFLVMISPILSFITFASVISMIFSVVRSLILNQPIRWY